MLPGICNSWQNNCGCRLKSRAQVFCSLSQSGFVKTAPALANSFGKLNSLKIEFCAADLLECSLTPQMKPSSKINFDNATEQAREFRTLSHASLAGGLGLREISSSDWQREREQILHRACQGVQMRIVHGEKSRAAFRSIARSRNGRPFRCDSNRRLALAESTFRAHYRKWKRGGEVPAAFRLHYRPRHSVFTAPMLIRFVNFFVNHPHSSMREAWEKFARRGGNAGIGWRAGKPLKISYSRVRYNFPAANFHQVRAHQEVIKTAEKNVAVLQQKLVAEIAVRFPERPPRLRVRRETDFQI